MDKYGVGQDPSCYPGTVVLRNRLDIRDQDTLDAAEAEFTAAAMRRIEFVDPPYSMETWRSVHRALFRQVYEWAGELRTVDISKDETRFCKNEFIDGEGRKLFSQPNSIPRRKPPHRQS